MAYRVFVSYSSRNLDVVDRAKELWESDGVRVFVAEHSVAPGEPPFGEKESLEAVKAAL